MRGFFLIFAFLSTNIYAQALFFQTPRPKNLIDRFFAESISTIQEKKRGFDVKIDEFNGKIDFTWNKNGKRIKKQNICTTWLLEE